MGRNIISGKGLTTEQFQTLLRVVKDVYAFSVFIYVIHPLMGKTAFKLYPYQRKVLYHFLTEQFSIVLKFRQAGLTELISMYALWLAMFHPNKNVQIISIKDRVAKKVLRKIKYMYKNLPKFLQTPIVNGRTGEYGTAMEIEFSNGSTISSIPTTEDAGRSEAVTLLVIDEAAIVRWANTIWAAAFPTLSTGGSAIVNSTPYGIGNWYHKTWSDAIKGQNGFIPIRLKWWMHPERDQKWYDKMSGALGPRRTAQEIDGDFLTSGTSVFDLNDIKAIEDMLETYTPIRVEHQGSLRIFKDPKPGEHYFIGADISTGRSRDYTAFTIMNSLGEEFGVFKGKLPTNKASDLLAREGKRYNNALLAPESNDIGLAVTADLQNNGYPNLYYSTQILKRKKKRGKRKPEVREIPGWLTTRENRPIIIDELEEDIRLDNVEIKDPFFTDEAYTFIYDSRNRPVAMGKDRARGEQDDDDEQDYSDDSIFGKSITNYIRKQPQKTTIIAPV